MEELDSSSHIARKFRHDYHLSPKKQMIEKVVYWALPWLRTMQFMLAHVGTGIAVGNDMFSYMKGLP